MRARPVSRRWPAGACLPARQSVMGSHPTYGLVVVYFSVAKGIMSPDLYRPAWSMDTFTNMVISSIVE